MQGTSLLPRKPWDDEIPAAIGMPVMVQDRCGLGRRIHRAGDSGHEERQQGIGPPHSTSSSGQRIRLRQPRLTAPATNSRVDCFPRADPLPCQGVTAGFSVENSPCGPRQLGSPRQNRLSMALGNRRMRRKANGRPAVSTRREPALFADRGWRLGIRAAAAIVLTAALALPTPSEVAAKAGSTAQAEPRKGTKSQRSVHHRHHRFLHGPDYQPPYADIVVDDNSAQVLHETNSDSPRHPASLTKIMTLYLLFEQLQVKKLSLESRLQVSPRASAQAPTKLGLKPTDTIRVEDAIKGIVTRSANDAAVGLAEAISGSEREFAELMTRKAQTLGMTNTVYVNASGLPADAQITTAREQALLGRAIQD